MSLKKMVGFFSGGASERTAKMILLKQTLSTLIVVAVLLMAAMGFAYPADAELYSRANGTMVYDSDLDITWLVDANYAATVYEQSYGQIGTIDGKMEWAQAMEFVEDLVYEGFTDWRLPTSMQPDPSCEGQNPPESGGGSFGFYCTHSEMGHLFYKGLGGQAGESIVKIHNNNNYNLFRNIVSDIYWLSTQFAPFPVISLNFHTLDGYMNFNSKTVRLHVWPVRDGDVD
ncbi:DUF1566 domain-containing protein [aff. Roholtiella sp. LEGE 12411]|uniref:DUF1566 domain-containing protein n=1 Tax=aff. Roholtiella sp. LEGE 12411 TaxID=1828822 RepID=UPI0018802023|nr:DUF1566 domain-containing protein [aff. Roholtiella sp. LEGE 12411]MBE9033607.1 DUF1566 domain-containing protein [aff. Roholtiella sp. LEGE 12411]